MSNLAVSTDASTVSAPAKKRIVLKIACLACLFITTALCFAALWYNKNYTDTGFEAILLTLFGNVDAAQPGLVQSCLLFTLIPSFLLTAVCGICFFVKPKKKFGFFPLRGRIVSIISLALSLVFFLTATLSTGFWQFVVNSTKNSLIFTQEYVDPASVKIKFPEAKRNLIYIYLESMETTFFSKEQGGALEHNAIPELYNIAKHNINFSHNEDVGGFKTPSGTTWTIAALTAQTAGIPLKAPDMFKRNHYGKDSFLPGVTTLTNILKDNGYYQALMFGSDAVFAHRDVYFNTHGMDKIYDYNTAIEDGLIPEDYFVWWGMEDMYLYEYAKRKLPEIAKQEQPFAFTMLTVDTHHIAGYKCGLCRDKHIEQYDNVYSCASRQLSGFLNWLKRQSFYKDTTVIICGDHTTMDSDYIDRNVDPEYEQHVYNAIINSGATYDVENYKNRAFCGMDMFPTTLAALGCDIPGNRLGLGTNLFSARPTLIESMGYEEFNRQISRKSDFYLNNFIGDYTPEEE